jgi:signal transduction histidine kinase/ligand-binding sensor domain-containing protein
VNTHRFGTIVLAVLAILVFGVAARAADAPANLLRTHFTVDNGFPGNVVEEIGQTPDGFLWVISNGTNLIRFDGRTFYGFEQRLSTLAAAPGGDLWIGTREALIRVPRHELNQFAFSAVTTYHPGPGKETRVLRLRVGRNGVLWIGTSGGLFRYDGTQFVPLGPRVAVREIEETPEGRLLLVTETGFVELDGSAVVPHPGLADRLGVTGMDIFHVLKDRRGNTWYSTAFGLARETGGRIEKLGTFAPNGHAAFRTYEDPDGAVWVAKEEGLFRATASGLESIAPGLRVRQLFGDRDGNLWVGTNGDGLYRFRPSAVRMFTKADGLPENVIQTVMTARDGTLWTGANCGGLSRFDGTRFQTYAEQHGLLNSCVWALAEDANRDLWVGTWGGGAFRFHDGTFTQLSTKEGLADDRVTSILAGRDGTMWFGTYGGVSRLKDGQIRNFKTADGASVTPAVRLLEDRSGVIWAGTRHGLQRFVQDRFELFPLVPKSIVIPVGDDREHGFLIGDDGRGVTIRVDEDRADAIAGMPTAYDMIETREGDLWFGGPVIFRVPHGRLTRVRASDEPLDYEAFSTADGLATADVSTAGRGLAMTRDGRVWAATPRGLAMFDLGRLPVVNSRPSIYITNVTIGRHTARAGPSIVLPAGTNHLQIDFGAVEVSSPEKIRLQYRLDDVDSEWLDAGRDPHAIYSTLPIGTHLLHIRASNRSGIWDREGVAFSVTQRPFFFQTRWFAAMIAGLVVLLAVGAYRVRVRQISRAMSVRFDERLAERTRMARDLHDTLLQTVQGTKMVADNALDRPDDAPALHHALQQVSAWLGQASEEGRATVNALRTSTTESNNLAEAFRRAVEDCRRQGAIEASLSVTGDAREMHPVVRDEVYRIGYEAIRNACTHSRGTRLDVALSYGRDLTLRVADDGIGMESTVAERGKDGHYGLPGMRERAARIGATFSVTSAPGAGTAIVVSVPGRVIFRKSPTRRGQAT